MDDGHSVSLLSDDTTHETSRSGHTLSLDTWRGATSTITEPTPAGHDTEHTFSRRGHGLPLRVFEIGDGQHSHMLVFGEPVQDCLVRIHSRCLYGESLRSDDCDCGPELDKTLDMIQNAGGGVLIYLEQEGRGEGLIAKARGYHYSEQHGADTFTSYEALGYSADARSYTKAAECLHALLTSHGLTKIQLLTNNPAKAGAVRAEGIAVTVVPLRTVPLSARATSYLEAKRRHRQHWIPTDNAPWALESAWAPLQDPVMTTDHGTLVGADVSGELSKPSERNRREIIGMVVLMAILATVVVLVVVGHARAAGTAASGGFVLTLAGTWFARRR